VSLNSVQSYVKSLVDGIPAPNRAFPDTKAYIQPPVPGDLGTPSVFVWGATFNEQRQAGKRGQGYKEANYRVHVWLMYVVEIDNPDKDYVFPLFIDIVLAQLRGTALAVPITDPITAIGTQLLSIGEKMEVQYAVPRTLEDQRYLLYSALVITNLKEVYIG
jgi:hypothetical protein